MRILDDKCFNADNLTLDSRSHAFNLGIAQDFSPVIALWLAHLAFWAEKNLANNKHIHDGLVWCYDTLEALADYFPYLTKSQRETMINNSVKHGLVVTGNYNHTSYDRTVWYALTPKAYYYFPHLVTQKYINRLFLSISEKSEMDFGEFGNRFPNFRMTIPDTAPDTDPDKKREGVSRATPTFKTFPTPKDRNETAAYESDELQKLFASKFSNLNLTYDELFKSCKEYYESKRQWVTSKKWKNWIEREKTDIYKKNIPIPTQTLSEFTEDELTLAATYRHAIKYDKQGDTLKSLMPKLEDQVRAKDIITRMTAKESLRCQTPSLNNSARKNSLTSASSLVSRPPLSQRGS